MVSPVGPDGKHLALHDSWSSVGGASRQMCGAAAGLAPRTDGCFPTAAVAKHRVSGSRSCTAAYASRSGASKVTALQPRGLLATLHELIAAFPPQRLQSIVWHGVNTPRAGGLGLLRSLARVQKATATGVSVSQELGDVSCVHAWPIQCACLCVIGRLPHDFIDCAFVFRQT